MPFHRMLLALGSNIRAEQNLPAAVERLRDYGQIAATSRVWQSKPVGYSAQPDFLNAAVLFETDYSPQQVVNEVIPAIESALQRRRDPHNRNAPRTIDIDLVMLEHCGDTLPGRDLPDPQILDYAFLAQPLADIAAGWIYPGTNRTLNQIAGQLTRKQQLVLRTDVVWRAASGTRLDDSP